MFTLKLFIWFYGVICTESLFSEWAGMTVMLYRLPFNWRCVRISAMTLAVRLRHVVTFLSFQANARKLYRLGHD